MKTVLLALSFVLAGFSAHAQCRTDSALLAAGWNVHPSSEFATLQAQISAQFENEKADFVFDLKTEIFSSEAARWVAVNSYDRLSTAREVMFGDILFITDKFTDELVELRWFDGQTKHAVSAPGAQSCVMDLIPYADNALF